MPKQSAYPRLRKHVRSGKSGQVWVNYYYDMRGTGQPDIALGSDHEQALAHWRRLHNGESPDRGLTREAFKRWINEELPTYEVAKTRGDYGRHANRLMAWCGAMRWEQITLPLLHEYLRRRSAKTQGNREMAVFSIVWGKARLWGMTKLPWPADGVKNWKNPERARTSPLNVEAWQAIRAAADWTLGLAMDVATATAMRVTDTLELELPTDLAPNRLLFLASKTGKPAWFDIRKSPVLQAVLQRRAELDGGLDLVVVTEAGKRVSESSLRRRWDAACDKAAADARTGGDEQLAEAISGSWLRDQRKLAAKLTGDAGKAKRLLQHASEATTRKHYFDEAEELEPVQ